MKKIIIALSFFAYSCNPQIYPNKGSYPNTPIVFYSDKSKDVVWDNLIDFFAQKGLSIKILDKASGLIISEKTELSWSYENDKDKLMNPNAFVVIPLIFTPSTGSKPILPYKVTGEWNVRIKSQDGRTSINVNLLNFDAQYIDKVAIAYAAVKQKYPADQINGRTTGVFEKTLSDIIK